MSTLVHVPGCDTHVFISYARIDNRPFGEERPSGDDEQRCWVSAFHDCLEKWIPQVHGEDVSIWFDEKLRGSEVLSQALAQRLHRTAVFVAVLSRGYLKSKWCKQELETFIKGARTDLRVGNDARIIKVLKRPVPLEEQPLALREILGFEFYREETSSGKIRELRRDPKDPYLTRYYAKIDDVAQDISKILERMSSNPPETVLGRRPTRCVYLARTSYDLEPERDDIRRDLEQRQTQVLPQGPLPDEVLGLERSVQAALEKSSISVHPIGRRYGMIPEGSKRSLVELQLHLATRHPRNGRFTRLIWLPERWNDSEERLKQFVERLETEYVGPGTELIEAPLEKVKTRIGELLAKPPREIQEERTPGDVHVYVVYDQTDRTIGRKLKEDLEQHDITAVPPLFNGSPEEIRKAHERNLKYRDALLFVYGDAREAWLCHKLLDPLKALGRGRERDFLAIAVYTTRPSREVPRNGAMLLSPETGLEPFLRAITQADGGRN